MSEKIDSSTITRKSMLYMPGDELRKIRKATQLPVDSVIMDIEDGVALNRKDVARHTVLEALQTLDFGKREKIVRPSVPDGTIDIEATVAGHPDAYLLPKVETPEQVLAASAFLERAESEHGWITGSIRLMAMIETALGVMNLKEIAISDTRLAVLVFGADDLASSVGATRTPENQEVFYARSALVTAAAAYNLDAIDMVFFDLHDMDAFAAECANGKQFGFVGKSCIHPRQVEIANRVFSPSPEEIDWAKRLTAAFVAHQQAGRGAFAFEGKMVDMPIMRAAQRILTTVQTKQISHDQGDL